MFRRFKIADTVTAQQLKDNYGFKYGSEFPPDEQGNRCLVKNWLYLFEYYEDENGAMVLATTEEGNAISTFCIRSNNTLYLDLVPDCTYHIMDDDAPQIFNTFYKMIKEGVILDETDYNESSGYRYV